MKKLHIFSLIPTMVICLVSSCDSGISTNYETNTIYKTSGDETSLLELQDNIEIKSSLQTSIDNVISIDNTPSQEVDMFGGALTHSSAYLLMKDEQGDKRKEILKDLFSNEGANFNAIRLPIGSSDFHSEDHFFTCCDTKGNEDDLLANFNLSHDENIMSVIKEIYEIKPDLKIVAAPWSAPAWMMLNANTSSMDPNGYALCNGTLNSEYISTYAEYLTKFITSYKENGITINYLSLINEPLVEYTDYPSMQMPSSTAVKVSLNIVNDLPDYTSLIAYDHNCEDAMYTYLADEFYINSMDENYQNIAIHGYGSESIPDALPKLRALYPDKKVYMTEITEYEHNSTFSNDIMYAAKKTCIIPYNLGLSGTIYWNLVLNSQGGPNLGQYSTCYGVVNMDFDEDGSISYSKNPAYYALSHVSKGLDISDTNSVSALRISTNNEYLQGAAFITEDNIYELSLANTSDELVDFEVEFEDYSFSYQIEGNTLITFTF
jgi:glucosylceramidase